MYAGDGRPVRVTMIFFLLFFRADRGKREYPKGAFEARG